MPYDRGLPVLEGTGFELRPLKRSDAKAVLDLLQQPAVARWWGKYDRDRLEREFYDAAWAYAYLVISDGTLSGLAQFHEVPDPDYKSAAIDIVLAEEYRDRGLGPEVLRTLISYLIDDRGHHRLTIDPAADNTRAIRAYEKVGFKPVGVMRQYEMGADGLWHDGLLMDLLAEDFAR